MPESISTAVWKCGCILLLARRVCAEELLQASSNEVTICILLVSLSGYFILLALAAGRDRRAARVGKECQQQQQQREHVAAKDTVISLPLHLAIKHDPQLKGVGVMETPVNARTSDVPLGPSSSSCATPGRLVEARILPSTAEGVSIVSPEMDLNRTYQSNTIPLAPRLLPLAARSPFINPLAPTSNGSASTVSMTSALPPRRIRRNQIHPLLTVEENAADSEAVPARPRIESQNLAQQIEDDSADESSHRSSTKAKTAVLPFHNGTSHKGVQAQPDGAAKTWLAARRNSVDRTLLATRDRLLNILGDIGGSILRQGSTPKAIALPSRPGSRRGSLLYKARLLGLESDSSDDESVRDLSKPFRFRPIVKRTSDSTKNCTVVHQRRNWSPMASGTEVPIYEYTPIQKSAHHRLQSTALPNAIESDSDTSPAQPDKKAEPDADQGLERERAILDEYLTRTESKIDESPLSYVMNRVTTQPVAGFSPLGKRRRNSVTVWTSLQIAQLEVLKERSDKIEEVYIEFKAREKEKLVRLRESCEDFEVKIKERLVGAEQEALDRVLAQKAKLLKEKEAELNRELDAMGYMAIQTEDRVIAHHKEVLREFESTLEEIQQTQLAKVKERLDAKFGKQSEQFKHKQRQQLKRWRENQLVLIKQHLHDIDQESNKKLNKLSANEYLKSLAATPSSHVQTIDPKAESAQDQNSPDVTTPTVGEDVAETVKPLPVQLPLHMHPSIMSAEADSHAKLPHQPFSTVGGHPAMTRTQSVATVKPNHSKFFTGSQAHSIAQSPVSMELPNKREAAKLAQEIRHIALASALPLPKKSTSQQYKTVMINTDKVKVIKTVARRKSLLVPQITGERTRRHGGGSSKHNGKRRFSDPLGVKTRQINVSSPLLDYLQASSNQNAKLCVPRFLEVPLTAPKEDNVQFLSAFVEYMWATHRVFSLFSTPHRGLTSVARVTLFFGIWNLQLILLVWLFSLDPSGFPRDCISTRYGCVFPVEAFSTRELLFAIIASAMTLPLSIVLLSLLSKMGPRHAILPLNVQSRTVSCGFLRCFSFAVCLTTAITSLALLFANSDYVNGSFEMSWLYTFIACVLFDWFGTEMVRIFLYVLFMIWLNLPTGVINDPKLKRRIFRFWSLYIALGLAGYGLYWLEKQVIDVVINWTQANIAVAAILIYLLVTNSSNIALVLCMLICRPPAIQGNTQVMQRLRSLHDDNKHRVAVLITTHLSADILQQTLEAALHIFKPNQLFVCDNGRSTNPLDLWECCNDACTCGVNGSKYFTSEQQVEYHHQRFPNHMVRGYPQGKTAWVCEQVSNNYNQGCYNFHLPAPGSKPEAINYVYIPEGSKMAALWYTSKHYVAQCDKFSYILQIDDDVLLPPMFDLPFENFISNPKTMAVALPLHAVNMKQPNPHKSTMFTGWQELEYRSFGYLKYVTSQLGTAMFCHGASSFWRKEAFDEVLNKHDTMHGGDDVQMGLNLHGLRGKLQIANVHPNSSLKIDTAWHAAIGTQVPVCWVHLTDIKLYWERILVGLSAGFGERLFHNLFKKWRIHPCSCGEPSLFFQRAMGWDTTEHRFLFKYCSLLLRTVTRGRDTDWILAIMCLQQLYTIFVDVTRIFLFPTFLSADTFPIFLAGIAISWVTTVAVISLFSGLILRRRGHVPPPYAAIWAFPLYKLITAFVFRPAAFFYNVLWYLPFNQNKATINRRVFKCDCEANMCSAHRYEPPFYYYSKLGHMPPGPQDADSKSWKYCHLNQWHTIDAQVMRKLDLVNLKGSRINKGVQRKQRIARSQTRTKFFPRLGKNIRNNNESSVDRYASSSSTVSPPQRTDNSKQSNSTAFSSPFSESQQQFISPPPSSSLPASPVRYIPPPTTKKQKLFRESFSRVMLQT